MLKRYVLRVNGGRKAHTPPVFAQLLATSGDNSRMGGRDILDVPGMNERAQLQKMGESGPDLFNFHGLEGS